MQERLPKYISKCEMLADESHEISYLIFFRKLEKTLQILSSAAVVIVGFKGYVFACLGVFHDFLSLADFFFKIDIFKNVFLEHYQSG